MATFSTNQVKQLYVATELDTTPDALGDIAFVACGDGQIAAKYFGKDGIVRTDIIDLASLKGKAIKASAMGRYLESAYIANTSAVAGQQYILKVTVNEFGGVSPEDKGFIFGEYVAKSGDAAKNVIAGLALSLAKNATKAAACPLINVFVTTGDYNDSLTIGTNAWKVTPDLAESTIAGYGSLAGLVIEAAEQPWVLGKEPYQFLSFSVAADPIRSSGIITEWATVSMNTSHPSAVVVNSKKIADLEWFCAGERGDVYRGMGYPNNFEFDPTVNPATTYGYHLIDLTWGYKGDAEDIQVSPKELIIVVAAEGATTYTAINGIIGTASSGASAGTLNKAIYDSGFSNFIAQLS